VTVAAKVIIRNKVSSAACRAVGLVDINAERGRALGSAPLHLVRGPGPRACPVTRAPVHGSL
jgi:hypothetical protein